MSFGRILRGLLITVFPLFLVCVFIILVSPLDLLLRPWSIARGKFGPFSMWFRERWVDFFIWVQGFKVKLQGMDPVALKSLKGVMFVANHQSLVDIPVLFKTLPQNISFLGKRELSWIPLFGLAAWLNGVIYIDRSKGTRNGSLKDIQKFLSRGISVVIFAEGTRSEDGRLNAFKRGAFVMAIQAKAPIVPVTLMNTHERLPKKELFISPGHVHVMVDEPIQTKDYSLEQRHELADRVHQLMSKHLDKYRESIENRS
jgi:1-acyl-sn-glycerol-3-phosphate acyltransferase